MWHFQTSAWNRCFVGELLIRYSKHSKHVQQEILSEIISGQQIDAVQEFFFTFSGFKIILHTVLFFLSLIYFSDLFFFLEEKVFCQKISLES